MYRFVRLGGPALALVVALLSGCVTQHRQVASQPSAPAPVYSPNRGEVPPPVYSPSRSEAPPAPRYSPPRAAVPVPAAFGTVRSIEGGASAEPARGGGAVLGGVIGAVVGRQFADSNRGKNVGTVAGAVGGALIGNEIEKNARRDPQAVRVQVQLDQGGLRSFDFQAIGDLRVGDRVRIEGNQLYRL